MRIALGQLRLLIREAMLSPGNDMALCVTNSGVHGDKVYVLYDPALINVTTSTENLEKDLEIEPRAIIAYIQPDVSGEIHSPVAIKGYGPFMYELAMAMSANGIYPDRESTSASAMNVWRRFMQRDDVVKTPIEDSLRIDDDSSNPKNYRFSFRDARAIDVDSLIKNHQRIHMLREKLGDKRFDHRLWSTAHSVYGARMRAARRA